VFHPLAPRVVRDEYITGPDEIKALLADIKKNLDGKSGSVTDVLNARARGEAAADESEWDMDVLARLLGRIPASIECQQQPYSLTHLKPEGAERLRGFVSQGPRYNLDYSKLCARSRRKARIAQEERVQTKRMLTGMGDIEKQLAMSAATHGTAAAAAAAAAAEAEATAGFSASISAADAAADPNSAILGSLASTGYHGRVGASAEGASDAGAGSGSATLPGHVRVVPSGMQKTVRETQFQERVVAAGIHKMSGYTKLRVSAFMELLKRGVFMMDVAGLPGDVAEAVVACLSLPFHTFCLVDGDACLSRKDGEAAYKKNNRVDKFTSGDSASHFAVPASSSASHKAGSKDGADKPNPALGAPLSPYHLCKLLSSRVPAALAAHAPSLTHIELRGLTLVPGAWTSLIQGLAQMPLLRVLYLRFCNLSETHVASLTAVLGKTGINHLAVSGCGLGPSAAYPFSRLLGAQVSFFYTFCFLRYLSNF
jgi:ribosomal protein L18